MKRITMKDIAERAGVSRTTVSLVINNKAGSSIPAATQERILDIAHDLGYFAEIKRDETNTIVVLVRRPFGRISQAAFPLEVLRGLSSTVDTHGFHVTMKEVPPETNFSYIEWVKQNHHCAIVLDNIVSSNIDEIAQLCTEYPVISVNQCSIPGLSYVDVDHVRGTRMVMEYLIKMGHRRIAMVNYASRDHLVTQYRLMSYKQSLYDYNIPYDESIVCFADFTSESGQIAMAALLNNLDEFPSAVFVSGDVVAAGAMQAARDYGLSIPADISFASFDDVPFARYLTPSLTTSSRPAFEIGKIAGELLIGALKDKAELDRSVLLESKLMIRDSVAPYQTKHKRNGH